MQKKWQNMQQQNGDDVVKVSDDEGEDGND